ncbi:MAG: hypothetical protein N4J56_005435 [Chroococcidiopsis sp. SAG 2025]|nr:hypothetical protein [Chroococcidiopsis sp. SAG 2025]
MSLGSHKIKQRRLNLLLVNSYLSLEEDKGQEKNRTFLRYAKGTIEGYIFNNLLQIVLSEYT